MPNENTEREERRHNFPGADHEKRISLAEKAVNGVEHAMSAVNTKLDLILAQITQVAILEEKHSNLIVDNDRAHKKIGDLADKVDELAKETRAFMNYSSGRDKVLWAIGGVVLMLVIKGLFFAANSGMQP